MAEPFLVFPPGTLSSQKAFRPEAFCAAPFHACMAYRNRRDFLLLLFFLLLLLLHLVLLWLLLLLLHCPSLLCRYPE
jgi:hypothetical protein